MNFLETFSSFVGLGSLALFVLGFLLLIFKKDNRTQAFLVTNGPHVILMVSFLAVMGSLIYSDVLLLEPCLFCWYQRIVMYPIPLLLALSLYRKEPKKIVPYALFFSYLGMIMATYHYLTQMLPFLKQDGGIPLQCGTAGPSCTEAYIEVFGFVTIPFMAMCMFFFLIVVSSLYLKHTKVSTPLL